MSDYRHWSHEEDSFLKEAITNGGNIKQVARLLSRSESAVEHRLRKLGIDVVKYRKRDNAKSFDRANVRFPFYKSFYRGKSIECEGRVKVHFKSSEDWMRHVDRYCSKDYNACFMCKRIMKKYE